jgi:hypothetical protein
MNKDITYIYYYLQLRWNKVRTSPCWSHESINNFIQFSEAWLSAPTDRKFDVSNLLYATWNYWFADVKTFIYA